MSEIAARSLVLAFCVALGACSTIRHDVDKRETRAFPPAEDTNSARYISAELQNHVGESGFRLLTRSNDALMSRIALADHARHSLDLQYYIFKNDETGRLVAQKLLAAADRGVRVRILLDDTTLSDQDRMLDALDAHENIEIRLFNPFHTRNPSLLSKVGQFLVDGSRLNRRMHNKSFIADNRAAIVGGRNVGNDYFDAGKDTHFRDLDVIAIGPVVSAASQVFDDYWNCDAAYPVQALSHPRDAEGDLAKLRNALTRDARTFLQSDYAQQVLEELPEGATGTRWGEWFWGKAELVADQPEKIETDKDLPALRIGPRVKAIIDSAQHEVLITSPYFVPGKSATRFLSDLVARGVDTRILTNSLAATDEPVVHTGYAQYRKDLLTGGVKLYELQPSPGAAQPATSSGTSSGVSLHAKSVVVDDHMVFIGSMNMDPRSKLLNTEMGVIVDSPKLASAVREFFEAATRPESAFELSLERDDAPRAAPRMVWHWRDDSGPKTEYEDPGVSPKRRVEVLALALLPIEGLL